MKFWRGQQKTEVHGEKAWEKNAKKVQQTTKEEEEEKGGGLKSLHETEDNAHNWLETSVTTILVKWNELINSNKLVTTRLHTKMYPTNRAMPP